MQEIGGNTAVRITREWSGMVTSPVWLLQVTNALCSFAVSGGCAFTQARRTVDGTDKEVYVALNTANGSELWATPSRTTRVMPAALVTPMDRARRPPEMQNRILLRAMVLAARVKVAEKSLER